MEFRSIETLFRTLNDHQIQYLVVGGLAVVAHGYVRFTANVDLIFAFDDRNLTAAITALKQLNYRPRAPVPFEQFADPNKRKEWLEQKGMKVFSLFSADHAATEINLFIQSPVNFSEAIARAEQFDLATLVSVNVSGIEDLIQLKTIAGRPIDLEDIRQLRLLQSNQKS